jgi:Arc/MetJ-type ribon-helix-helix transcriptional regulator
MNVMLNADDQELVDGKVSSGQYPNPDAVVADAIRALRERALLNEHERRRIRKLLDECWAEANNPNTEWVDGEEFMTRFEAEID